jgi:hypothetical protein
VHYFLKCGLSPIGKNSLKKARMGYPKILKPEHLTAWDRSLNGDNTLDVIRGGFALGDHQSRWIGSGPVQGSEKLVKLL